MFVFSFLALFVLCFFCFLSFCFFCCLRCFGRFENRIWHVLVRYSVATLVSNSNLVSHNATGNITHRHWRHRHVDLRFVLVSTCFFASSAQHATMISNCSYIWWRIATKTMQKLQCGVFFVFFSVAVFLCVLAHYVAMEMPAVKKASICHKRLIFAKT